MSSHTVMAFSYPATPSDAMTPEELEKHTKFHAWAQITIVVAGIVACLALVVPVVIYKAQQESHNLYKQEVGILKQISISTTYQPRERKTLQVSFAHAIVNMNTTDTPNIEHLFDVQYNKKYRLTYKINSSNEYIFVSLYKEE